MPVFYTWSGSISSISMILRVPYGHLRSLSFSLSIIDTRPFGSSKNEIMPEAAITAIYLREPRPRVCIFGSSTVHRYIVLYILSTASFAVIQQLGTTINFTQNIVVSKLIEMFKKRLEIGVRKLRRMCSIVWLLDSILAVRLPFAS